jgi:sensor histidine kinase YesM
MLIENAIKHNRFSANDPLDISIRSENGFLLVENSVRKKTTVEISSGIGLENIRKRYELVSGQPIDIAEDKHVFRVKLPVIV